ncbi:MAG: NADPH-dependent FMN reductase [Chloroflexota bacterium]
MQERLTILGVSGSLREHSFNRALIKAAAQVAPDHIDVKMALLHDIPFYNADVEAKGIPAPVQEFKQAIAEADGVLFATPQYNRSVPGVLKNAIDWASRPAFQGPLAGKPCAIVGATPGKSATAVAREHLEIVLDSCRAEVMEDPQIGLINAKDHIEDGVVTSEEVRANIRRILETFAGFVADQQVAAAAD